MNKRQMIDRYDTATNKDDEIAAIAVDLLHEALALIESRNAKTNRAVIAVFREVNQRWIALSNERPEIARDGFLVACTALNRDFWRIGQHLR